MGIDLAAKRLGIEKASADSIMKSFFSEFEGVRTWIEEVKRYVAFKFTDIFVSDFKKVLDALGMPEPMGL